MERVTAQHEDPEYKGPKEDCVEECKILSSLEPEATSTNTITSLPPPALRNPMCSTEALQAAEVNATPAKPPYYEGTALSQRMK